MQALNATARPQKLKTHPKAKMQTPNITEKPPHPGCRSLQAGPKLPTEAGTNHTKCTPQLPTSSSHPTTPSQELHSTQTQAPHPGPSPLPPRHRSQSCTSSSQSAPSETGPNPPPPSRHGMQRCTANSQLPTKTPKWRPLECTSTSQLPQAQATKVYKQPRLPSETQAPKVYKQLPTTHRCRPQPLSKGRHLECMSSSQPP